MKLKPVVFAALLAAATVGNDLPVLAHGDEKDGHHNEKVAAATAEEALKAIQETLKAVEAKLKEKDLKALHELTDAGMKAAQALQEKATPPAAKKTSFEAAVKQLSAQFDKLHVAADAGDQAKSEVEFKKAGGALKLVEANLK